jgi:hypothetical protein
VTIVRHEAGEEAPENGTYALVGHFGEATSFAVWCRQGERLPLVIVSEQLATPLWFVRVSEQSANRLAA